MKIKETLEKAYNITIDLENGNFIDFDYYGSKEVVIIRLTEDSLKVSVSLELDYRSELTTQTVLNWANENVEFYLYKDSCTLTKTFNIEDVTLETIEDWIKATLDKGI